jgi:hypothetical protein
MSDTTTDETTFGIATTEIRAAYHKAVEDANTRYHKISDQTDQDLIEAATALRKAIGHNREMATHLIAMARTLAHSDDGPVAKALAIRDAAITKAEKQRDEAMDADPFTRYVSEDFTQYHGDSRAETILDNAPYTFASLRKLADHHGWCSDFEHYAMKAVEAGVIPDETVEVRYPRSFHQVPDEHNPQPGEQWEAVLQVYAFVRTTDDAGDPHRFPHLRRYAKGEIAYVKVADAEPVTETATGDDPAF